MVTTLKWNNIPCSTFRTSFGLEQVLMLSSGLFLVKQCPLLERGTALEPHTSVSALLEICIAKKIHLHY